MANPGFTKALLATAAIAAYTIVKPGANDGEVIPAAAASDALIGVNQNVDVAIGQTADIIIDDQANVLLGGTVAAGDPITSDANGKGIKAVPAAGANARIIGFAAVAGVAGDIAPVYLSPGIMQG